MKKIIVTCIVCFLIAGIFFSSCVYPKAGIVIEVNYETDTVTVEDCNGDLWEFGDTSDWEEGDIVAMIMFDCFSKEIYDDIIVSNRYCGYIK